MVKIMMPQTLSIVTFISKRECFNPFILNFYFSIINNFIYSELIIFTDFYLSEIQNFEYKNIRQIICKGTTKYRRILSSLSETHSDIILYIDNDIHPYQLNLEKFLYQYKYDIDLYFGKIDVIKPNTFIERLITIDKCLSHNVIRPLLWNLNVGISVPGQIFLIKKQKFFYDLQDIDTVFDDLFIGICSKMNQYKVQRSVLTLGAEKASNNIITLLKQRIRWSRGYYECCKNNKNKALFFIIIHGIAYHLLLPSLSMLIVYLMISPYRTLCKWLTILAVIFAIIKKKTKVVPYLCSYIIIFSFVHMTWLTSFISLIITAKIKKIINVFKKVMIKISERLK